MISYRQAHAWDSRVVRVYSVALRINIAFVQFCFQCFDAVGWVAGRASGL